MTQPVYRQVIDEDTGAIQYVPVGNDVPPSPPPKMSTEAGNGSKQVDNDPDGKRSEQKRFEDAVDKLKKELGSAEMSFETDPKMTDLFKQLQDNNKRLRFKTRLQSGKLDTRQLTRYKTSDKLFKQKSIKHKDYQFTIMLDTSGSMGGSKIRTAVESIYRLATTLDELKIPTAVVGMNLEVQLLKGFDQPFDMEDFANRLIDNFNGTYDGDQNCGGTHEYVAYTETLDYIKAHSGAKTHNVVFVLSDGEPGGGRRYVPVNFGEERLVDLHAPSYIGSDSIDNLRAFWLRQSVATPYGIGIRSSANQVPNNRQLEDVTKLPAMMGRLLQEILL